MRQGATGTRFERLGVARQNMRVTLGELLTQLDLQELCHDGVVSHGHEGRARTTIQMVLAPPLRQVSRTAL